MNQSTHPENGERSSFAVRMCSLYAQDGNESAENLLVPLRED